MNSFEDKYATKEDLAKVEIRLIKWIFLLWVGQLATMTLITFIKDDSC